MNIQKNNFYVLNCDDDVCYLINPLNEKLVYENKNIYRPLFAPSNKNDLFLFLRHHKTDYRFSLFLHLKSNTIVAINKVHVINKFRKLKNK